MRNLSIIAALVVGLVLGYFFSNWKSQEGVSSNYEELQIFENEYVTINGQTASEMQNALVITSILDKEFKDATADERKAVFDKAKQIDHNVGAVSLAEPEVIDENGRFIDWETEGKGMVERFTKMASRGGGDNKFIRWSRKNFGWKVDAKLLMNLLTDMEKETDQILLR